jgi:hypothetical protein
MKKYEIVVPCYHADENGFPVHDFPTIFVEVDEAFIDAGLCFTCLNDVHGAWLNQDAGSYSYSTNPRIVYEKSRIYVVVTDKHDAVMNVCSQLRKSLWQKCIFVIATECEAIYV